MNVKQLKDALATLPDDMEVIMQKDSEGNGFSPLHGADPNGIYVAEEAWYGEVYDADWTADDCCMNEDEWAEIKALPRALILYPVN
jgi:hypothetical protein